MTTNATEKRIQVNFSAEQRNLWQELVDEKITSQEFNDFVKNALAFLAR